MSQPTAPTIELPPGVAALIPMRNLVLFPYVLVPISEGRAKSITALETRSPPARRWGSCCKRIHGTTTRGSTDCGRFQVPSATVLSQ